VFFTSGTTGKPKGVVVSHRGLVKRIQWFQNQYCILDETDRILQKTPYVFGISEWEFFWALPHGAAVVLCRPDGHKDPEYLTNITVEENITIIFHVPSMLTVLLEYMRTNDVAKIKCLKHVFCCGEALPLDTCRAFFQGFSARLHNLYGPTEADMTYWECPPLAPDDKSLTRIPIGRPMQNVKVYVLDDRLQPVPPGVPGELFFGGETTATGYLNLPELTAEKFLPNPFYKGGCGRMYRTGDLVRWRSDCSEMDFLGRVDFQIKLRGFRIELGEIETVLETVPVVKKAVVLLHGDTPQTQQLVAYVIPETVDVAASFAALKEKLPDYMIPSVLIPLPAFPVTSRGKLDRKALPNPDSYKRATVAAAAAGQGADFVGAHNEVQRQVEEVWQSVLNIKEPLNIRADFVSLGGNSLLAGRITSILRKNTGVHLKATAMYTHATIEKIGRLIADASAASAAGGEDRAPQPLRTSQWFGKSSTSFMAITFQLLALMLLQLIGNTSYLPGYYILYDVYLSSGMLMAIAYLPVMLVATNLLIMLLTVIVKFLVLRKAEPGEYPVWGFYYLRWWFTRNLLRASLVIVAPLLEETALYNIWLRLLGMKIGSRVLINTKHIGEPSLIQIDDDVRIELNSFLLPHAIESGLLILKPIRIGTSCVVNPRAYVVQGTMLLPDTEVGPLSTTGVGSKHLKVVSRPVRHSVYTQPWSRVLIGLPLVHILQSLAFVPSMYLLEWCYYHGGLKHYDDEFLLQYALFGLILAVAYTFIIPDCFFALVVVMKWFIIGKFWPGPRNYTWWPEFRRWLHERLVLNQLCEQALRRWHSTEILAMKYRLLGAHFGWKTQPDFIQLVEHDLLFVEDGCVFGSNVNIAPGTEHAWKPVIMRKDAQVLDHCTLMGGVEVGRNALMGTTTVGAEDHKIPPFSINVGNSGGKAVLLRTVGDIDAGLVHLPPNEREAVRIAKRNHQSNLRWGMFNLICVSFVLMFAVLPQVVSVLTLIVYYELAYNQDLGYVWPFVISIPLYSAMVFVELALMVLLKYIVIGRYREGNYPFYGRYHFQWILMMCLNTNVYVLLEEMGGTVFSPLFFRAMGAKVGKDACIFGSAMEFDLLQIGAYASVGDDCDLTNHTVENMVIKLAPTKIGRNATMRAGAIVMPGGVMQDNSCLMEVSVVLKGEVVSSGLTYAGLPADRTLEVTPLSAKLPSRLSSVNGDDLNEFTPLLQ
jgi:amino acid adenylation domain-containing protein